MQTPLITETSAAYSPAGMSDLFFTAELTMAATITHELTSRTPLELSSERFENRASMSLRQDDDDIDDDEEDDDLDDDDDDEEDEDEEEDELDEEDEEEDLDDEEDEDEEEES